MKIKLAAIIFACIAATGCTYGGIYAEHVSSPFLGFPVTSREDSTGRNREGAINEVGIELRRCYGRVCAQSSLGYDFNSSQATSLRGGPWLYEGRVSIRVFGETQ